MKPLARVAIAAARFAPITLKMSEPTTARALMSDRRKAICWTTANGRTAAMGGTIEQTCIVGRTVKIATEGINETTTESTDAKQGGGERTNTARMIAADLTPSETGMHGTAGMKVTAETIAETTTEKIAETIAETIVEMIAGMTVTEAEMTATAEMTAIALTEAETITTETAETAKEIAVQGPVWWTIASWSASSRRARRRKRR